MFIPDLNNSILFSLGLLTCTSYNADEIAIDVSMIFPIKPIIIIQLASCNMLIPVLYST